MCWAKPHYGGVVTACGLAQGMDLPGSMTPFILRAVTLVGIESVRAALVLWREAWAWLARDLDRAKLEAVTQEVALADVPGLMGAQLSGGIRGRTLVRIG